MSIGGHSADLSRTMAALDSELRRAERWATGLCRRSRSDSPAAAPEAVAQPY